MGVALEPEVAPVEDTIALTRAVPAMPSGPRAEETVAAAVAEGGGTGPETAGGETGPDLREATDPVGTRKCPGMSYSECLFDMCVHYMNNEYKSLCEVGKTVRCPLFSSLMTINDRRFIFVYRKLKITYIHKKAFISTVHTYWSVIKRPIVVFFHSML